MKKIALILLLVLTASCVDQNARYQNLRKQFPNYKITPGHRSYGKHYYDFLLMDTTGTVLGVDFYPFSDHKIANMHRIY